MLGYTHYGNDYIGLDMLSQIGLNGGLAAGIYTARGAGNRRAGNVRLRLQCADGASAWRGGAAVQRPARTRRIAPEVHSRRSIVFVLTFSVLRFCV